MRRLMILLMMTVLLVCGSMAGFAESQLDQIYQYVEEQLG